jgi:hypothetical protein
MSSFTHLPVKPELGISASRVGAEAVLPGDSWAGDRRRPGSGDADPQHGTGRSPGSLGARSGRNAEHGQLPGALARNAPVGGISQPATTTPGVGIDSIRASSPSLPRYPAPAAVPRESFHAPPGSAPAAVPRESFHAPPGSAPAAVPRGSFHAPAGGQHPTASYQGDMRPVQGEAIQRATKDGAFDGDARPAARSRRAWLVVAALVVAAAIGLGIALIGAWR